MDSVSTDFVAVCLSPEDGPARMPIPNMVPTAMAHATVQFPFYTDANGNGLFVFFPYAVGSDANSTRSLVTGPGNVFVMNDAYGFFVPPDGAYGYTGGANFDSVTGRYTLPSVNNPAALLSKTTKGIQFIQGPLAASNSSIQQLIAGP